MLLEGAAFVAIVRTIIVERNFDFGFLPFGVRKKAKKHILDVLAASNPLLFVSCLNGSEGFPIDVAARTVLLVRSI